MVAGRPSKQEAKLGRVNALPFLQSRGLGYFSCLNYSGYVIMGRHTVPLSPGNRDYRRHYRGY